MKIEAIKVATDWIFGDTVRTRIYKTYVTPQGKTVVDSTEYHYVPYSERGKEVKEPRRGEHIDVRA